jgi:sulfhydrogenase subunit alpha
VSHRTTELRSLSTAALARVEGEGAMRVEIRDGRLVDVQLAIYEPPRFFEALLRGRGYAEPVDLTARICGICPVAYQLTACAAVEDAAGVVVDGPLRDLRRVLYCGEWIQSHVLHVLFLHAPDFLGYDSTVELAAAHRADVERGLALKRIGNLVLELLGGRAVHPVNVKLGGFHRLPSPKELATLRGELERGRDLALALAAWVAAFDFPDQELDAELVAVDHPTEYPMLGGHVRSDAGLRFPAAAFGDHVEEHAVAHSTALHARLRGRGDYLVGPLARYSLHAARLSPAARRAAQDAGLGPTCRNPFRSIVVRAVEVVHACETALALIDAYEAPDRPAVPVAPVAGTGHGITEAPRGLLHHRYTIDGSGLITDAAIVPPTSQNQAVIEGDVRRFVAGHLHLDDDELRRRAEVTIRNHDPCISCATHFLDLTVHRT